MAYSSWGRTGEQKRGAKILGFKRANVRAKMQSAILCRFHIVNGRATWIENKRVCRTLPYTDDAAFDFIQ